MTNYFKKLSELENKVYNLKTTLDELVEKYLIDNYPYGNKKGEICPGEWSWNYDKNKNVVIITYWVWVDNYQDHYSDEKQMMVDVSEILNSK